MIESTPRLASAQEVVAELRRRSSFVMVSHVKPDGDTLGAGLALGLALKRLGKRVAYFQQDSVPRNLRFLPDAELVARTLPSDLPDDTLYVFCDMSDWRRAGEHLPPVERENMLDIDHHLGNSLFGKLNFVLENECSTGSVVMHLLRGLGVTIDRRIATCILATVMTDTGGFMHSNTTPGGARARGGVDAPRRRQGRDYARRSSCASALRRRNCWARIIEAMRFEHDGRYCYSYVDDAMLARDRRGWRRYRRHRQHAARTRGSRRRGALQGDRGRDPRELALERTAQRAGRRATARRRRTFSRFGPDLSRIVAGGLRGGRSGSRRRRLVAQAPRVPA